MNVLQRLNRIVTADAHAVLDGLEQPQIILKQSIRQMQTMIDEKKSTLKHTRQQVQNSSLTIEKEEKVIQAINDDISLCIEKKQTDLAKESVRKKLIYKKRMASSIDQKEKLEKLSIQLSNAIVEYEAELAKIQSAFNEMSQCSSAENSDIHNNLNSVNIHQQPSQEEIDIAWLHELKEREV